MPIIVTSSWKTTFFGVLAAVFAFVVFSPELFVNYPWLIAFAKFAMTGGLAGMGLMAKDKDSSPKE